MKWGMFVGWQNTAMSTFETLTGKQPQMEVLFAHWGNDTFPSDYAPRIRDKGRTMVLFWEAVDYNRNYFSQPEYSMDSVIAGKMDTYFAQFAADAKAYGGEVILAPYSEFNSNWFPWGITMGNNSPEKFIKAWIHIHSFFVNVPNVKFAWVPNNDSVPDIAANNFDLAYPGSQYVDVIGIDAFNSNPWETFDQMLGTELVRLRKYNKPTYILSMGVKDDARKGAWITDAFTTQLYKYPELKGWVWFNENKEFDWRINSNAASLSAFKSMLP
jgi:beta-mannanase